MKPIVQPGSASALTAHDSRKGGKGVPGRRTRATRCSSVEQLESRCLLSTVTEFPALPSGFAGDMTSAAGKLWFTVQSPSAIGMLDPSDPTHTPHLYSAGIGGIPVDITTGPDGNVWFTEPKSHAIGMINTTSHLITIYNSADGLPANAEPQGITSGKDATGKPVLWFTDTITNASLGSLGRIDPADPTHIPAEIPIPATNIGFYKYNKSKIVSDPATGNLWFSEVKLDINSNATKTAIGRYNPQTNTWTEWALTSPVGQQPLSLIIGPGGNPWFSEIVPAAGGGTASSQLGMVDPANPTAFEVTRSDASGRHGAHSLQDHGRGRRYNLVH